MSSEQKNSVNSWWNGHARERFWLAVVPEVETREVLAIPEESRTGPASWVNQLPAYVAARDVVFQYDPDAQAITSWSRAKGPGQRKEPGWTLGGSIDRENRSRRARWMVGMRGRKRLETPVPLEQIARVQWELFPELRALEEKHGDPLYYPFALGSPDETHTLPGRFFKLPSLFVDSFPATASVAHATRAAAPARTPRRATSWWHALEEFLVERPNEAARPH